MSTLFTAQGIMLYAEVETLHNDNETAIDALEIPFDRLEFGYHKVKSMIFGLKWGVLCYCGRNQLIPCRCWASS